MINQIPLRIDTLLNTSSTVVIAIDGSCAAGKTTLANRLAKEYDCNVLRMDDFFLRPEQRTPQRYAQIGGNVDYERFFYEVVQPLKKGAPFSYRAFNCSDFTLSAPIAVTPKQLNIVEGSYSMHPYFGDIYDLKIFLTIDPIIRKERIEKRPKFLHQRFFQEWIPMEQAYFEEFRIAEKSDIVLSGSERICIV